MNSLIYALNTSEAIQTLRRPRGDRRLTIAYFSQSPGGQLNYEKWQMWRGIAEAAKKRDINLLYIAGGNFQFDPEAVLYDLISSHNVDGIIFWNSFFSQISTESSTDQFLHRYNSVPVVGIELALDGYPCIMLDNSQAMREMVAHLVGVHGYQKIAYISENKRTSHQRQQIFEKIMMEYGLFNPQLVGTLDELDKQGLTPGTDYQAALVHDDNTAANLIENFQARGIMVPDDVAITGFNDGHEARAVTPPLTTIRIPFRRLGRRSIEIMLDMIRDGITPEQTWIPLNLIVRRSCGCLEPMAEKAAIGWIAKKKTPLPDAVSEFYVPMIGEMAQGLGHAIEDLALEWTRSITTVFLNELSSTYENNANSTPTNRFLRELNEVLRLTADEGINVNRWHVSLSVLRRWIVPYLQNQKLSQAEDMLQQARVLVGQTAARTEARRNWQVETRLSILRKVEEELLLTFDLPELIKVLVDGLTQLNINGCYLVLYENPSKPAEWARLVLVFREGKEIEIDKDETRFFTHQLLPERYLPSQQSYSLLVEALHLGNEQIGYIAFEVEPPRDEPESVVYEYLQTQLSSALKGMRLRQQQQKAVKEAEEANQLKSRFLSMVSHELRTPINLIVGLSELALRETTNGGPSSQELLHRYQEQIYISGQHLDRLIRDVLDLARSQVGQMSLICETLDIIPILHDASLMGQQLADQKQLSFQTEIPDHLPKVWGDKTRLRQILLNLLSNAVKFTAHGEITVTAFYHEKQIWITVKDTGLGIPLEEQDKIFDEFQTSERTSVRGYGGIGLGLAITKRLVELHGGKISVTSSGKEGSGSTFTMTLPIISEEVIRRFQTQPNRSQTVLILSSATGSGDTLAQHLKQQGFLVETAMIEEVQDPIEFFLAYPPGAIVLDFEPASEQGWDLMKTLKEHPETQDIPVLFYSLVNDLQMGSLLEMDYLNKPLKTDELVKALDRQGLKFVLRKKNPTILIIDDDQGILELHATMVQNALPGCDVLNAQNGRAGMEIMRQIKPDLILLDLLMPEMDGFAVLNAMQEDPDLRGIPVIVLSAQTIGKTEMDLLNQGVAAVLGKGLFSSEEILERVECVLGRNKRLGSESQRLVRQAMTYIHSHYNEPISRTDIAHSLSINEQYLTRCFNKEVGLSPIVYLNRYRIQQAKKLLEMGDKSITSVALETGFSSQSYFSRMFQRETGYSPSSYQRREGFKPETLR